MDKRSCGENRRAGMSKGRCVVVVQGGPEYADRPPTGPQRAMECESNRGAMIGSVVVVRDGHSSCGAGQHTGAVLGLERMMSSREEGW